MSDRPKPHWDDEWHPSISEDYARAPDDVRRRILLSQGYDKAHESEVARLFPSDESEQLAEELKPNHDKDRSKLEKLKSVGHFIVGASGVVGTIVLLIVERHEIALFFESLFEKLQNIP